MDFAQSLLRSGIYDCLNLLQGNTSSRQLLKDSRDDGGRNVQNVRILRWLQVRQTALT